MKNLRHYVLTFVAVLPLFCCFVSFAAAQTPCPGPPPIRGTAIGNIFTEQQEMDLGDAIAEQFERNFKVVHDDQLNSYLNEVAQRLLVQVPPTQMKFRVVLVDLPVVNAFTMPGGRIYVTRKLVAFVESEDELAGVLAHELGHALTHQPAANLSHIFRQVLDVKQVGDRADIFLKYNQLIENIGRKHLRFDSEENQEEQMVADSYGLYAMTRAGYSPRAMGTFWDRLAQTQGKTGNWLTDFFGGTTPSQQRLRQMRQAIPPMPADCIATRPNQSAAAFQAWQRAVIAYTVSAGRESLPGLLWKRQLSPPLESEITNVKFSPDGKYLLAQDDFSVYVLTRQSLRSIFRIPVNEVEPAAFTPDSQSVLIWTHALHIEKWSVASHMRTDVHEMVTPESCMQTDVSPDGAVAACIQGTVNEDGVRFDLSLLDVATGAPIISKHHFYGAAANNDFAGLILFALSRGQFPLFYVGFSPDGRYFAISRQVESLAWDLRSRLPVKLSPAVRDLMSGGFTFDGPDRIVGVNGREPGESGSAQFPSGPVGMRFPLFRQTLTAPTRGEGILVRPAGDRAVALVNLKTGKAPLSSQMSALDVYDRVYARPRPDGSIGIFDLETREQITSTSLPVHWIGWLRAADVSPDMNWFAASGTTRGAVWNLATGDRVFHVRGFGTCGFSSQDNLYAGFNAYLKQKRSIGILSPSSNTIQEGAMLDEHVEVAQLGTYLLYVRRDPKKWNGPSELEVHDVTTGVTLWVKHFSHTAPQVATSPSSGQITFVLPLTSDEAKEEEKQNPALRAESKEISSKDAASLIQVVSAQDGKLLGEFAVDTGGRSFLVRQALPAGKWVVVADNQNRALVYSLDGKLTGRLFGIRPIVSGASRTIVLESETGTLALYDLATLARREELVLGMPLAFYQFVDNGSKLFVLTEDQTAYLFSLDQSKPN